MGRVRPKHQTFLRMGFRPMRCSSVAQSRPLPWGRPWRRLGRSDGLFFELRLLRGVSQHVARPRNAPLPFEPHQVDPAELARDLATEPLGHPLRDESPGPELAARRWPLDGCQQVRLLLRSKRQRLAPRVRPPPVRHPLRSQRVVALDHLADPATGEAGAARDGRPRLPLAHQPHDLPPRPLDRAFGRPIAALHLVRAQVRGQPQLSAHAPMLLHRARLPPKILRLWRVRRRQPA